MNVESRVPAKAGENGDVGPEMRFPSMTCRIDCFLKGAPVPGYRGGQGVLFIPVLLFMGKVVYSMWTR